MDVYEEGLQTDPAGPTVTGVAVPVEEGKKIVITISDNGNITCDSTGGLNNHEIIGVLDVIIENIKRQTVMDPKLNQIVEAIQKLSTGNVEKDKDSELLKKLKEAIKEIGG